MEPMAKEDDLPRIEARRPEWMASFGGFTIYTSSELADGWIELRDEGGNVIAKINGVKSILIAERQRT